MGLFVAGTTIAVAFNLVCTGTFGTVNTSKSFEVPKDFAQGVLRAYRIDLDAKRWCMDVCAKSFPVLSATSTQIVLADDKHEIAERYISINRETGDVIDRMKVSDLAMVYLGTCQRAPFSGLPQPKF